MPKWVANIFYSAIAVILAVVGVYVLTEQTLFLVGRYTANLYKFSLMGSILMASACFMMAGVFILGIKGDQPAKRISQRLFTAAIFAFFIALFMKQ